MAALRSRIPVLVLVALGCLSVGIFMLAHGVSTPGLGSSDTVNIWFHRFPIVAIAGFSLCLTVVTRRNNALTRFIERRPMAALLIPTIVMVLLGAGAVAMPSEAAEQHDSGPSAIAHSHHVGGENDVPGRGYLSQGYGDRSQTELVVMVTVAAAGALMLLSAARAYW